MLRKTGYSRPHTVHCGPEGIYISTLGGAGADGTRGAARRLHHGLRELRDPAADGRSTAARRSCTTTSGGTCRATTWCRANGACRRSSRTASSPKTCSATGTATRCTSGICARAGTCRPSTSAPTTRWRWRSARRTIRRANTASSAWSSTPPTSKARSGPGTARTASSTRKKTATIPPEPADAALLPPLLKGFGAVPPLISDIDLSLDDRFLYVACWGTGELRQYDVTDPMQPKLAGSVRIGGIARHDTHPNGTAFGGGPQMTEISRDGKRVYFTNSLYSSWDTQFYPDGVPGVQVMCNVGADGGIALDPEFFVDFGGDYGAHQMRLKAATARPIRSATRRPDVGSARDARRQRGGALARGRRDRRLSRPQPGDGLAARGRQRHGGAPRLGGVRDLAAARRRPLARDGGGAGAVRAARLVRWRGAARSASAPACWCCCSALYRLVDRRHPRCLARVRPTQLALWSFLMAHRARRRADAAAVRARAVRAGAQASSAAATAGGSAQRSPSRRCTRWR